MSCSFGNWSKESGKLLVAGMEGQISASRLKALNINSLQPTAVYVEAEIGGRLSKCLVDTGAAVSLVNKSYVDGNYKLQEHRVIARGLGGHAVETLGLMDLSVRLSGWGVGHLFVVADMEPECILGADFLFTHDIEVKLAKREMVWGRNARFHADLSVELSSMLVSSLEKGLKVNRVTLDEILKKNDDLFVDDNSELGRTHLIQQSIDTGDSRPIKQRPYQIPVHLVKEVDSQIEIMLKKGLIHPITSPWSSPLLLIP